MNKCGAIKKWGKLCRVVTFFMSLVQVIKFGSCVCANNTLSHVCLWVLALAQKWNKSDQRAVCGELLVIWYHQPCVSHFISRLVCVHHTCVYVLFNRAIYFFIAPLCHTSSGVIIARHSLLFTRGRKWCWFFLCHIPFAVRIYFYIFALCNPIRNWDMAHTAFLDPSWHWLWDLFRESTCA